MKKRKSRIGMDSEQEKKCDQKWDEELRRKYFPNLLCPIVFEIIN